MNIRLPDVGAKQLVVDIRARSPDGATEHLGTVAGNFLPGREIRVNTIVGPSTVEFEIDGKPVLGQPIAYKADSLELGCSSAECIFTMLSIF